MPPIARSGKPQNRALIGQDQPDESDEPTPDQRREVDIRRAAKTGAPYKMIAEKYGITIQEVMQIINPDLAQRVDAEINELF